MQLHEIEAGLASITSGLQGEIRYGSLTCANPENVLAHTVKLGIVIQWLKLMIELHDPEKYFDGELLSDLALIHDFGEAHENFGDIAEPLKTEMDEETEQLSFLEMIEFLPEIVRTRLWKLYDVQKADSIESKLFRVSELLVRIFYCLREIQVGNTCFWKVFWNEYEKIQPFLKEFNGLRVMFVPIQEFADLVRSQTPSEP